MELNRKIKELEDEIKILKGEVKSVLVEIREYLLTRCRNPLFHDPDTIPDNLLNSLVEKEGQEAKGVHVSVTAEEKEQPAERPTPPEDYPEPALKEALHKPQPQMARGEGLDLSSVLRLARWVGNGIRKVGRERLEKLLEIYHMAGYLSPNLKEVILKLIRLAEENEPTGKVTMKDCIMVLLQLDELIKEMPKSDLSLLSLLFDEEVEPWTGL